MSAAVMAAGGAAANGAGGVGAGCNSSSNSQTASGDATTPAVAAAVPAAMPAAAAAGGGEPGMAMLLKALPAAEGGGVAGVATPPALSTPPSQPRKALKVGKYILLKTLGKGSSSEVKLGQHLETGEQVAIKVMAKAWIHDNGMTAAVNREIQLMAQLKHRNVVELKEVMNSSTCVYMVLELVKGHELYDEIVQQVALSEAKARAYFRQIVDGIGYLHSQGVCHRDLKPENILISPNGTIKITDFGLSAMCGSGRAHRRQRSVCGTPYYTAPEVFTGAGARPYDARRADVWSAGVVLYTMLAGQLPFEGSSAEQALHLISTAEVSCPAHFSAEARDLVARMLIKESTTRISLEGVARHPWTTGHRLAPAPIVDINLALPSTFALVSPKMEQSQERGRGTPAAAATAAAAASGRGSSFSPPPELLSPVPSRTASRSPRGAARAAAAARSSFSRSASSASSAQHLAVAVAQAHASGGHAHMAGGGAVALLLPTPPQPPHHHTMFCLPSPSGMAVEAPAPPLQASGVNALAPPLHKTL